VPSLTERLREARARRRRAMRQFLVVGLCFAALLCLGGVAVGFLFYDRATKPDLSTPEHVTRKYLEAYLVDRDDYAANQYRCSDASGLTELQALRDDIDARQRRYGVSITGSLDRVHEVERTASAAKVDVDLVFSAVIQGAPQKDLEHWEVSVSNESGWRVCGANELK